MKPFLLIGSVLLASLADSSAQAQHAHLLVAEKGAGSLSIVDPIAGKVIATVPENGITGHEVAASPDGRYAFVPIYGNSGVGKPGTDGQNIVVIDLAAHKIVDSIEFPRGVRPHCPQFGPDGLLYVTTELDQTVTVIDPKTFKIVGAIPTGQPESHMLVISHDGLRGYTANVGPGTVSVLDMKARKVIKIIPVSGNTQRIAISPDDRWVFTADQTAPRMAVIDTRSDEVKTWVPLDGLGYGSAATLDGHWVLMAIPDRNDVNVVDLKTMKVARTVKVGGFPQEVLMRPDGKVAYVSCQGSNQVAEIDLATWKVTRLIETGKATDGLGWAHGE